jgi:hypothetical protein
VPARVAHARTIAQSLPHPARNCVEDANCGAHIAAFSMKAMLG